MSSAIPPSPDRPFMHKHKAAVLAAAAMALALFLAAFLAAWNREPPDGLTDPARPATGEERRRNEALALVRRHLAGRVRSLDLDAIDWVETHHEGHRGYYRFDGRMGLRYGDGETRQLYYVVVAEQDRDGTWSIREKTLEPDE